MSIVFSCPDCAKRFQVKSALAGKKAKCPCGRSLQVPSVSEATTGPKKRAAASPSGPAPMRAKTAKQSTTAAAAAKRTKRPQVSASVTSATDSVLDDPLAGFGDLDDAVLSGGLSGNLDSLLDEVASEQSAVKKAGHFCPSCQASLSDSAVICIQCGLDLQSGERLRTESDKSKRGKKAARKAKSTSKIAFGGSLLRGTIFSLIGSLLGGAIWVVVALFLGLQIGWLAWGMGGMAGAGMALGHEDDDGTMAGIIAAGCAIAGLLAAKAFIFFWVLMPLINSFTDPELFQAEIDEEVVATTLMQEEFAKQGVNEEELGEEAWDKAYDAAFQKIEAMSDDEYQAVVDRATQASEEQGVRREATIDDNLPKPSFFEVMFGPIDGLFILLAVGTAYSLGSGQKTD